MSITILSVPLETAVGLSRSVGEADGWWEAGRVRDTQFSKLLEIVLVCILFWQHSWRRKGMCIFLAECLSANLFYSWKANRIASDCCMDYQLMKHDGEYAAESMVKKMAAKWE